MFEKLKVWIISFKTVANSDLSTLALVKIVEELKRAHDAGAISKVEKQELHKLAMKILEIEV
jgi:hypothetical protein